ncbi:hypothetical protein BU15DRAFT_35345, partial [Melanogaster broomeanus]
DHYWHALCMAGSVFRLDSHLWIMQDWDSQLEVLRAGLYVHIVRLPHDSNEHGVACNCSHWKASSTCIHQMTLQSYAASFQNMNLIAPSPLPPAVLLHMTPFVDKFIFSCVSSVGRHESGKRVIVSLRRDGRWHCQSCRFLDSCKHRPHAISFAVDSGLISIPDQALADNYESMDVENTLLMNAATRTQCSCGLSLSNTTHYPEYRSVMTKPATIYGLTLSTPATIDVLPCPVCRHACRSLGSDLGTQGLFNWNNNMLFTHELLNAFTSAFTASETPFSAFCLTVRRAYLNHSREMEFCSDETFVRVWFKFTQIQMLDSGMWCPTCGSSPEVVIADGISLGTHVSKLTASIQPPTFVDVRSEKVESISSYRARGLPAIIQRDMRSIVNKIVATPATCHTPENISDIVKLANLYPQLWAFIQLYVHNSVTSVYYKPYRDFIQQIAAPDIVLQLVPLILPAEDWYKTGTYYGLPAIRKRRVYSKLKYDAQPLDRDAEEMGDCNKFYKTYSKNNLTGGILVL